MKQKESYCNNPISHMYIILEINIIHHESDLNDCDTTCLFSPCILPSHAYGKFIAKVLSYKQFMSK